MTDKEKLDHIKTLIDGLDDELNVAEDVQAMFWDSKKCVNNILDIINKGE